MYLIKRLQKGKLLSKSKIKPKLLMLDKKLKHSRIQLECFSPLARLYDIIILHN